MQGPKIIIQEPWHSVVSMDVRTDEHGVCACVADTLDFWNGIVRKEYEYVLVRGDPFLMNTQIIQL
jgi:hypothetical protein